MLRTSLITLFALLTFLVKAEVKTLTIELPDVVNQPLYISNYEGDKSRIVDTITTDVTGIAKAKLDKKVYTQGLYKAILDYDNFIEFIVTDEDIHITADIADISNTVKVITSVENEQYYAFLRAHNTYHQKVSILSRLTDNYPDEKFKKSGFKEYKKVKALFENQIKTLESKAKPFTVALSKARIEIAPDLNAAADDRQELMLKNYFNYLDVKDTSLYYSDAYTQKAIGYISMKVSLASQPEQIIAFKESVDDILLKMSESKTAYDVVTAYLISGFESMQLAELVTYITDKYIEEQGCNDEDKSSTLLRKVRFHSEMKAGAKVEPFMAETLSKGKINSADFGETPLVLTFWASWCPHCTEEMPEIANLFNAQKGRKFELAMVSLDTVKSDAAQFVEQHNMTKHFNICDEKGWDGSLVETYNIFSTPTILVIKNGEIIAKPEDFVSLKSFLSSNALLD